MKRNTVCITILILIILFSQISLSSVFSRKNGPWSPDWPNELEQLHKQIEVLEVAHGIQETVFEVSFTDQKQFEKVWPTILNLKSYRAPLILEKAPSKYNVSGSEMGPGIRILWPSGGSKQLSDGQMLKASAPWPDSIKTPSGELPEYVIASKEKWIPFKETGKKGFRHRARVDIVLVVDSNVVDLNRISFPADTPIIDRRFVNSMEKHNQPLKSTR